MSGVTIRINGRHYDFSDALELGLLQEEVDRCRVEMRRAWSHGPTAMAEAREALDEAKDRLNEALNAREVAGADE